MVTKVTVAKFRVGALDLNEFRIGPGESDNNSLQEMKSSEGIGTLYGEYPCICNKYVNDVGLQILS
jgi:hypothetical protein